MTERARTTYLASPEAVTLHATFVRNVSERMHKLGWVHGERTRGGARPGSIDLTRLSRESGLPQRTVENLMGLANQPTLVGAAAIAAALNVRLDTLLGQEGDFGMAPASDAPSGQLACIHTRQHLPARTVCAKCADKWQSYQNRLRALYEANRKAATEEWDKENVGINLTAEEKAQ
jgi:hypothetical protein